MTSFVVAAKALADPGRARALAALRQRELCACQLVDLLGLSPSTVSKHMSLLKQAGLVTSRKEGRWAYYRRHPAPGPEASGALAWLDATLEKDRQLREDVVRLKELIRLGPEELCRRKGGR